VIAEVDTFSKNVTGRYILLKLSEHKNVQAEEAKELQQELLRKEEIIRKLEEQKNDSPYKNLSKSVVGVPSNKLDYN
jgi:hypothetical protein